MLNQVGASSISVLAVHTLRAHNRLHMALPKEIAALIETFTANEADYTASDFKEAQVR